MSALRRFVALVLVELRTQLRRPGVWVFTAMYAALGLMFMVAAGGAFEGVQVGLGGGNTLVDSAYAITVASLVLSLFTTLNVAAIAGGAACRDVEEGMHALVYSTPVPKSSFLLSRWLASLIVCTMLVSGIPVGLLVGAALPVLEAERVGAWSPGHLVLPMVGWMLPNLLFTCSLFFGIAALTRRMFPNYIGGVLLLVGYLGSQSVVADLDNTTLAAMIDPFGLGGLDLLTKYWSPHERNTLAPWPVGWALANRVAWSGGGLAVLLASVGLARLDQDGWQLPFGRRAEPREPATTDPRAVPVPVVALRFDRSARLMQLIALTRRALRDVLGHRYFWAFVAAAFLFELLNAQVVGSAYGTETWPVTWQVLEVLDATLGLFVLIVLTFYAGDLVWHERDLGSAPLFDSSPLPDALPLVAKAAALVAVVVGLETTVLVAGVGLQVLEGYGGIEPGLYVQWLYGWSLLGWLPYVGLALAVHAVVDHKVAGHATLIAFYVARSFRGQLGFEYHLFWFGSEPGRVWSDMNGWGWAVWPGLLYGAWWCAVGLGLLAIARLAWVRGTEPGWRLRLVEGRRRLDRGTAGVLAVSVLGGGALAATIVVESTVRRPYQNSKDGRREQARYERTYKAEWEEFPQPKITAVDLDVDLFPKLGTARARGTLALENRSDRPIDRMMLSLGTELVVDRLELDRTFVVTGEDEELGLRFWTLKPPLAPGERAVLSFDLTSPREGFDNGGQDTTIVSNGTFVHSPALLPSFGYDRGYELADKAERRKHDLPERRRMLDLDDPVARTRNYLTDDGDLVAFDARVTTDTGQTALAPGHLVETVAHGDRTTFHYRAKQPILLFFSFLSGAWEVRRGAWEDVAIEVYFHPAHPFNVDRMIEGVQDALGAFSQRFGPYQYDEVRIVEFPRYATFAQSFPSTIPYSEAIGFIARIEDPEEDIDYVYYVTAHEVAHQWWAHQLMGADAQGSTVLSETLAQYSSLTLMEQEYGADHVHRFLRYEVDRYMTGRAFEQDSEVPLMRVENQPYIHYNKGGVVLYGLKEAVGTERLDAAIRGFLDQWRYQGPPYPTARDFVEHLKRELPDAAAVIADGFERIVLYENRTTRATKTANADGTWTVRLELALKKTVADEKGEELEVPFDEEVEVGVFAGTENRREALKVERRRLAGPETTVELTVDREPTRAGVDPDFLLLDQTRDDNVIAVD